MKKNMSLADKGIRLIIAPILVFIAYVYRIELGFWQWILYVIALILIITAFTGHCWIYKLMKIKTKKGK